MKTTHIIPFTLGSLLLAAGCGDDTDADMNPGDTQTQTLTLEVPNLPALGESAVYEGWLITEAGPVSAGRFDAGASIEVEADAETVAASTLYVLTIEPKTGDDPAPSDVHIVAGAIEGSRATLSSAHEAAIGTDFAGATGGFILETPTSMDAGDFAQGVWFLNPNAGPGPSLSLPTLAAGWAYEGWVVVDGAPISTGRFTAADAPDSDGKGSDAGDLDAPPFPGQDFINPALDLTGATVVVSVEPEPDDSAAPFFLKPLVGEETAGVGGMLQDLGFNQDASLLTGTLSIGEVVEAASM